MAKLRNVGFILIAVLFLALSWGCTLENGEDDMPELSAELEMEIKQAYFDGLEAYIPGLLPDPEDMYFLYLGFYRGCIVVMLPNGASVYSMGGTMLAGVPLHHFIDDVEMFFPSCFLPYVWKPVDNTGEGRLYGIAGAYYSGLLTSGDLREISKRIKSLYDLS